MTIRSLENPHQILALSIGATPDEVRQAYLGLVRLHPPDRDPEKFREIHAAYTLLNDPLVQADSMLTMPPDSPNLTQVIEDAERQRPRLPNLVLLALGNE